MPPLQSPPCVKEGGSRRLTGGLFQKTDLISGYLRAQIAGGNRLALPEARAETAVAVRRLMRWHNELFQRERLRLREQEGLFRVNLQFYLLRFKPPVLIPKIYHKIHDFYSKNPVALCRQKSVL